MQRGLNTLPTETAKTVMQIIDSGSVAEVKRERDNIVVVEINRRVRNKTPEGTD